MEGGACCGVIVQPDDGNTILDVVVVLSVVDGGDVVVVVVVVGVVVVVIGWVLISVGKEVVLGGRVNAGNRVANPERAERVVERPDSSRFCFPLLVSISWAVVDSNVSGSEVTVVVIGTLVLTETMAAFKLVDGTGISVVNKTTLVTLIGRIVEELDREISSSIKEELDKGIPSSIPEELERKSIVDEVSLLKPKPVDRSVVIEL